MKFCTICPISGLEMYGRALSNHHLVLAQYMYNQQYEGYYIKRKQAGDFIILDNGAYENTRPIDFAAYFNTIRNLDPHVVVLPDILMSPWRETTAVALKFLDLYADRLKEAHYKTEWMFTPQIEPGDANEFVKSLITVVDDGRVGHHVKWIGLGRYLATEFPPLAGGDYNFRVFCAKQVKEFFPQLKLHALGMANGDLEELKYLRDVGVESIDSSAPVWRGWNGISIRDGEWKQKGSSCNFHADLSIAHKDYIAKNLEEIQDVLND